VLFIRRYTLKRTTVKGDSKNTAEEQPKPVDISAEKDLEKGAENAASEEQEKSMVNSTTAKSKKGKSKKEEH
jgi:hypothetical protein